MRVKRVVNGQTKLPERNVEQVTNLPQGIEVFDVLLTSQPPRAGHSVGLRDLRATEKQALRRTFHVEDEKTVSRTRSETVRCS